MTDEEARIAIKNWQNTNFPAEVAERLEVPPKIMVGHWLSTESNEEWYGTMFLCTYCNGEMIGASPYCPWCGKEMGVKDGKET